MYEFRIRQFIQDNCERTNKDDLDLDLVKISKDRCENCGTEPAGEYTFCREGGMGIMN
jgi:hypothetical protein